MTTDFGPPRWPGDTRPPFAPGNQVGVQFADGNTAAVKHGAWSDRQIAPAAAELLAGLLEQAELDPEFAHLKTPVFRPACRAWARCEARIERLSAWIEQKTTDLMPGDLDDDEEVRPAAMALLRLEQQALKHRSQLGLDPASFARLKRDAGSALISFDLASLLAQLDQGSAPRAAVAEPDAEDESDDAD